MEDFEAMAPMWKMQLDWDKRFDLARRDFSYAGEAGIADTAHLEQLMRESDLAIGQLTGLVKQWDSRHKHTVSLIQEELRVLEGQRLDSESKRQELLQADHCGQYSPNPLPILEEPYVSPTTLEEPYVAPMALEDPCVSEVTSETLDYWKRKAERLDAMLVDSMRREEMLLKQLDQLRKEADVEGVPLADLHHQLERVDNFLHFVLRNAPLCVAHQDKELRYRFIYNQYPGFLGEDIMGKIEEDFYKGVGTKDANVLKHEVMRRGVPAKREIVYDSPMFGTKVFLFAVEPVFSRTGDVIGINYVAMDVTDEHMKREKLIALREEAAVQRVTEAELHKTIHITEETMRAKQLLATMSHEIRSPLSGVISMAEILATTNLDVEQKQLVQIMLTSGDLVIQLINDILDLSKVESGVMKLEAKKFRPREVVKNVLQMVVASAQNKGLTLEGLVVEEVPFELIGDALRIRQIFINLVSNAIKFTHKGIVGVVVRILPPANNMKAAAVASRERNQDVVWLHIEVFDTGIGIPEDAISFLFDKYMQVHAGRKYGGTGLGLAICKQLVELMGGELKVASKENEGSTFSFIIPCRVSMMKPKNGEFKQDDDGNVRANTNGYFKFTPTENASLHPLGIRAFPYAQTFTKVETTNHKSKAAETLPCFKKHNQPKILLAEDNKVNVMVAKSMLKRLGLEPEVVGDGAEALKAVQSSKYDLILMDVCMPNMDGLEATKLIREYEETANRKRTPIIAMTANALAEDVADCYAHGMDSFVAKPATFKRLEHVLLKFLSHFLDDDHGSSSSKDQLRQQ